MNQAEIPRNHRDIELLLPWYVNETLEEQEYRAVERHLRHCAECRDSVRELDSMSAAVRHDSATPLVPDAPVDAFLRSLDATPRQRRSAWMRRRLAVAASLLAFVAAGVLYISLNRPVANGEFETVTNANGAHIAYVFEVEFSGDDERSRSALAQAVPGARLTRSNGAAQLIVTMDSKTVTELDTFAASLQRIDGIDRVALVGVQLPVE